MARQTELTNFRNYLSTLPDHLLSTLTQCYIWLADLRVSKGKRPTGLALRRNCCLAECARRGRIGWMGPTSPARVRRASGRRMPSTR